MTKHINIQSAQRKTILLKTLENVEMTVGGNVDITIVALLEKGWQKPKKLIFNFIGKNSTLNFIGIIIAKGDDTFPFETISNHNSKQTNSFYHIRSATFDQSKINYKGLLAIKKHAQQTKTYLSHHGLNFSNESNIQTIPSLEIQANNIHAGHAASIGKIDQNYIFYMQSRGIEPKTAAKILLKSFLESDLDKISDKKIKRFVTDRLERIKL